MKRKIRTVTVGGMQYVWQMRFAKTAVLLLSPLCDKTALIEVAFPCGAGTEDQYAGEITLEKGGECAVLKTCSPRMAALLLPHLAEKFVTRQTQNYDGFVLLREMGYRVTAVSAKYFDFP